jgi:hypothetical protein
MNQNIKEKHDKIKDRNRVLIRENMKLYRQLRLMRLKIKESQPTTQDHSGLETLAELATSIEKETKPPIQHIEVSIPVKGGGTSPKAL